MTLNYEKVMNWPIAEITQTYTRRETMLYAIGVGAATSNPVEPDSLPFVYEKNLIALPTMAVVLVPEPFWIADPAIGINWKLLLHGEQRLTIHKPLPPEGTLVGKAKVDEVYDKGPGKGDFRPPETRRPSRSLVGQETGTSDGKRLRKEQRS